jgi:N-acetylneuraminate lyase
MITLLDKYGGMSTGKAYMKLVGMDCGKFRSPVRNMTDKMFEDFVKDVEHLEISHLFSKKE